MVDTLTQAWHTATKDMAVWLIRALITTLAVTAMWGFWERIRKAVFRRMGWKDTRKTPEVGTEWRDPYLVRVWPLPLLRGGLTVADGTRVAVYDHALVQFELPAGEYSARDINRRLVRHAVRDTAIGVQVADEGMLLERQSPAGDKGTDGGRGFMSVGLSVDAQMLDRLRTSPLVKDGVLTRESVFDLIDSAVFPSLASSTLPADAIASRLRDQLGLIGLVHQAPPAVHNVPGNSADTHVS